MQYIFVAYVYDINTIIVQPMPSRTNALFISAFFKIFAILHTRDYQPTLNVMDNECSNAIKKYIRANKMDIQLVPLHNLRVKAAELAISTFKEHFIATALATVDTLYPLQLWDKFLPQVKLTLNLLRFSCRNPALSSNKEMYRAFDFNKTPLAPLGTKALAFDDPATGASWALHATNGYYVGPASNHYQCLHIYILAMKRVRFLDTWRLYPTHCHVPTAAEHDQTLHTTANLLEQLGHTVPRSASSKLRHICAICQLTNIMAGQDTTTPPNTASPRLETAAPPRVMVAAPTRVAVTSTNITAPNIIQRMPLVHQCHTRNNNPFQVIADDEDNDYDDTVVANNCSPPYLAPAPSRVLVHPPVQYNVLQGMYCPRYL
jgi:hypothetical protein